MSIYARVSNFFSMVTSKTHWGTFIQLIDTFFTCNAPNSSRIILTDPRTISKPTTPSDGSFQCHTLATSPHQPTLQPILQYQAKRKQSSIEVSLGRATITPAESQPLGRVVSYPAESFPISKFTKLTPGRVNHHSAEPFRLPKTTSNVARPSSPLLGRVTLFLGFKCKINPAE